MTDCSELVERLTSEGLVGMHLAAALYGAGGSGKPTHPATPTRHALKGIALAGGRRLKLEAIRVGSRLMTSKPAVLRFFAAQNEAIASGVPPVADTGATLREQKRRRAEASRKLDAILGT